MILPNSAFNVLYTHKIQETKLFYEKLGAAIIESDNQKLVVNLAGFDLHFILCESEPFAEYNYVFESGVYGQGALFYFGVSDIEEFFQLVKASKGSIKSEIKQNHWQASEFLFEDPNGYKLVAYE